MHNQLISEAMIIKQLNVEDALAVALYPLSGSFIEVGNFERFGFLIQAGGLDSAVTCQVQQATADDGTPKDITDAVTIIPALGDDKWYLVEVQTDHLDSNNDYNHVTLKVTGATGNDYGAITFIGFNPSLPP